MFKSFTLDHSSWGCHSQRSRAAVRLPFPTQRLNEYDFVGNVYAPDSNFTGIPGQPVCPRRCRRKPEWLSC